MFSTTQLFFKRVVYESRRPADSTHLRSEFCMKRCFFCFVLFCIICVLCYACGSLVHASQHILAHVPCFRPEHSALNAALSLSVKQLSLSVSPVSE